MGKRPAKRSKLTNKGYKTPKWFNAIKPGAHGSTMAQKRLWKVVSDTYRKADWETYGPYCPICNTYLHDWKDGQLGHWLAYSRCNSWFKFERFNLAMICAGCNCKDDAVTLYKFGEVLKMRHGTDVLLWIEKENQRKTLRGVRIEDWMAVDYVSRLRPDLVHG